MTRTSATRADIAETIAIGSELLVGGRSDSNSLFIADALAAIGIEVRFKTIVGDDQSDIAEVLKTACRRAGIVIMTGGLGPTVDDCTREAVASVTGFRLTRRSEALENMRARLAQWGRVPNKGQLRQALIPSKATVLLNPVGSAPGFAMIWRGTQVIALPGVPSEMKAMTEQSVVPRLSAAQGDRSAQARPHPITRVIFHTWGLPESEVDATLQGLIPKQMPIALGLLASPTGVLVSLTTRAHRSIKEAVLQSLAEGVRTRLREWIYAEGQETLEEVVGRLLRQQKRTVAVAESCTGGLIGYRLTQVPGSSVYVDRGVLCYSNRSKTELLGVSAHLIEQHGAVSREVAEAMARGMQERAGVSVALSVTGIAGPGGATETKPVGLVYIGLNGGKEDVLSREYRFHGDRSVIRQRAAQAALDVLRRWLIDRGEA
ncbi:MAG: competence/damage-inducible protein A [Nitrospira sp.]|nr:competence/damage-inducible protein A [Nitrospira sp.]